MKARAMTEKEEREVRAYSAFIFKEYGYQIAPLDPLMPVLYIHHKQMQSNSQLSEASVNRLNDAISKVNPQSFHFNHSGEAWEFQWGITFRWIVAGVLIVIGSYSGVWFYSVYSDVNKAREIINQSTVTSELVKRIEVDNQGQYFIDFLATDQKLPQALIEYKRINSKTVRIYLPSDAQKNNNP